MRYCVLLVFSTLLLAAVAVAAPVQADSSLVGNQGKRFGLGLYDPRAARFHLRETQTSGPADLVLGFGSENAGWLPITGDWNGNGQRTPGLYDPARARFHLRNSQRGGVPDLSFNFGPPGNRWRPVVGDWNGDGRETIGLYNPEQGRFLLRDTNTTGVADRDFVYGPAGRGWLPVTGDWNGDGRASVGLYDQASGVFFLRDSNTTGIADRELVFGPAGSGWLPLAGDWNGDGRASIGLFATETGTFYLRDWNRTGFADRMVRLEAAGPDWLPLAGRFDAQPWLSVLGQYRSGIFGRSAAEIVSYDPQTARAFVINAASGEVDVLDLSEPTAPRQLFALDVSDLGADANSVAVHGGLVAVAVEARERTDSGFVALYDADGFRRNVVPVGALPDALTFSPDGRYVLVANEGEPNDAYTIDPEGSVSIIDLRDGVERASVRTADFHAFNGQEAALRARGVRIFGPGATAAQDFEPEWVEVTADSRTAYVSLQENNAIGVIDIASATVTNILPLGFKDWSSAGAWSEEGFDASDRDRAIALRNWPVLGIYQPDTIRLYETGGEHYLLTANEGDARDYGGWSEQFRIKDLRLDPVAFADAADLQQDANLGRLSVTSTLGVANGCDPASFATDVSADCVYDRLYVKVQ